jgi:hypothetical protein
MHGMSNIKFGISLEKEYKTTVESAQPAGTAVSTFPMKRKA